MRDDEDSLNAAVRRLEPKLAVYIGQQFSLKLIEELEEVCRRHRKYERREHHIDFPEVVPIVLATVKEIRFFRKDLESEGFKNALLQVAREFGDRCSATEVSNAFSVAYRGSRHFQRYIQEQTIYFRDLEASKKLPEA